MKEGKVKSGSVPRTAAVPSLVIHNSSCLHLKLKRRRTKSEQNEYETKTEYETSFTFILF